MPGHDQQGSEVTAAWFDDANESSLQQPGWALLQQVQATTVTSSRCSSAGSETSGNSRSNGNGSSGSSSGNSSGDGSGDGGSSRGTPGKSELDIISFSHFLPHQDLLPEKRMLTYPNLVSSACIGANMDPARALAAGLAQIKSRISKHDFDLVPQQATWIQLLHCRWWSLVFCTECDARL
jgi:hypothetical protein